MKTLSDEELYQINNAELFISWNEGSTKEEREEYSSIFINGTGASVDTLQEQMWLNKKMRSRSGGPVE